MKTKGNVRALALVSGCVASSAAMMAGSAASAEVVYGVTDTQTLVSFNSGNPMNILSGVALSGLQQNEIVRGIDFRPATGELFALGSMNNLYTVNISTGAATVVGAGNFSPGLNGSSFGFDFNPVIDRIRIVSDANQNMVGNPTTGTTTTTGVIPVFYAAGDANEGVDPNIVGSAYTNSFMGALTTQLYSIDTGLDVLVTQANSAGTLVTVGSLGTDLGDTLSFDISGVTGVGYLSVMDAANSISTFWTIDLSSGSVSMIGEIGGGAVVTAISVIPAPGGVAVAGLAALAGLRRRR